jgi:hypothetical protein
MHCFFFRNGHVVAVELLAGLLDQDAMAKANSLFSRRSAQFEGFEIWERARMVFSYGETLGPPSRHA